MVNDEKRDAIGALGPKVKKMRELAQNRRAGDLPSGPLPKQSN